ncbi:hypothetical protein BCR42DRAFT_477905 [Absidia repens]|uniref:Uncharacterized protein n=1 Tax=Absidia repens TaxID=90262 RepID=A0A1X2ILW8_9FUNG|nr:hypothetical protein BCR42DRAFT_477905 [Absidia repens]
MQVELLRDIEPPSYEESVYFKQLIGQIKAQRRKTPPPSYENDSVFDVFKKTQLLESKPISPSVIGKTVTASPIEKLHDDESQQDFPMDARLERASSCLQQMIDAANQSLTCTSTSSPLEDSDTNDDKEVETNSLDDIYTEQREQKQQWRINRKKSLERFKSSQVSLARTIDQLNLSISQHINNEASISNYTQYEHHEYNNTTDRHLHHHHHHHHHHYYYNMHQLHSTKRQRAVPNKSKVPSWTNLLTQTALVFGIFHQLLSWSTPTSSILSVAWLVTMLLAKKKISRSKLESLMLRSSSPSSSHTLPAEHSTSSTTFITLYSHLKSSFAPRYSSMLSLFRKK